MQERYVLLGRWTFADREKGVTVCRLDDETGVLTPLENYFPQTSVGCIHVSRNRIFLADERDGLRGSDGGSGYILSASIDFEGRLTPLGEVPSMACNPTSLCLDETGRYLLVAHHGMRKNHATRVTKAPDGSWRTEVAYDQAPLMLFRLTPEGAPGLLVDVWAESGDWSRPGWRPHLHFAGAVPGGGLYIVTDPGTDSLFSFRLEGEQLKLLHKLTIEPGKMPRYVAFHPTLPLYYANNERGSLINGFRYDRESGAMERFGVWDQLQEPAGPGSEPSDLRISPDGRFLYGAVRGEDLLTVLAVEADGALRLLQNLPCGGQGPRGLCLSPDGRYLLCANQKSGNVSVFRTDADGAGGGRLRAVASLDVADPGCVAFCWLG